jgi:uncharacterized protein (TIGR03437 family)
MRLPSFALFLLLTARCFAAGFNYAAPAGATVNAVVQDPAGNTYLTGYTASATFPTTPGVFQPQYGGGQCNAFAPISPPPSGLCDEAFVEKLDPTGAVVWATYLGGSGQSVGQAIAVDSLGDVYVAGSTTAPQQTGAANNFPTTPGSAFPVAPATVGVAFVVKLNPAGAQMLYGTFMPDTSSTIAMTVDASGNAYVAATEEPAVFNFPTTPGAFQTSSNIQQTGLIAKLNATGSLVYATYLGGSGQTQTTAIAVDASGNAYITGTATATFPVTAGSLGQYGPFTGAFATKLNAAGSGLVYSTFVGGNIGLAIKADSQARAYLLGSGGSLLTTPGAFEPFAPASPQPAWAQPGEVDQFLASLSADGSALVYGTYISGALVLDVDASGNAYVAGETVGGFPVTAGAQEPCYNSNDFAAEFSPSGALVGATYFGAPGTSSLRSLAAGPDGFIAVAAAAGNRVANFLIDNPLQEIGPCTSPSLSNTVENAASYSFVSPGAIAPGELITLRGSLIGPETGASATPAPGLSGGLPTQLAGVQVFFGTVAAPLLYVQAGQINVAVPWEISPGPTQAQVVYNGTPSNSLTLVVNAAAPGVFYLNNAAAAPATQGAILNADGSVNTPVNGAHPGDEIALFGTGGGPTSPAGVTGAYSPLNANTLLTLPVTVQIAGVNAPVVYAGAAPGLPSGVFQINVLVPSVTTPNLFAPVTVSIGALTANQVTVGLQ